MNRRQVILLGATGQVGIFAIPRLLAAGYAVAAVSRDTRPGWYPDLEHARWLRPGELRGDVTEHSELLVSAGPVRLAADLAARCPRLERAVVFSTSSVFSKSDSRDRAEREIVRGIVRDEAALKAACDRRDIALTLFRPTLIYGCGLDDNVSRMARWIRRYGFLPVAGRAEGLRQPVHADDLAEAAVIALSSENPLALEGPLCGGSTLSFREMASRIFVALGRPERLVGLPGGLLAALMNVGRLLPGSRGLSPEMARRQARDLVFDDSVPRRVLGIAPRPFDPGARDFRLPDTEWLRRLAGRR